MQFFVREETWSSKTLQKKIKFFPQFFLSACLRNCFLCWDHWNSDVTPTLDAALLCSSSDQIDAVSGDINSSLILIDQLPWLAPLPIHSCVGAIANRGQWEQGWSLFMTTDLGPVGATGRKKNSDRFKSVYFGKTDQS